MDREQRRSIKKYKIKYKKSKSSNISKSIKNLAELNEGDKVKLNWELISSYDFTKLRQEYIDFLNVNKNTIFTVEYDKNKTSKNMVQFKEDTTNPKWLFWVGDLILLERAKQKPTKFEQHMNKIEEVIKENYN